MSRSELPRHPAIRELNRSLDLPGNISGELDWSTGIIRLNATVEQWRSWRASPTKNPALLATMLHEAQHALQIASFAKLYKTSLSLFSVAGYIDSKYPDASNLPPKLDVALDDPKMLEIVKGAMWDLTWRGEHDLSMLEIIEGVTHLTELRFQRDYDTSSYLAYLPTALVGPTYTNAFSRFFARTGQNPQAIWYFPPACHLALCSETPQTTFYAIADGVADGRISARSGVQDMRAFAQRADPDFLGWAWEWSGFQKTLQHPHYLRLQEALRKSGEPSGEFEAYVLRPDKVIRFSQLALEQPTILNPDDDPAAPGYREWQSLVWHWEGTPDAQEKARQLRRIVKLATIARRYWAEVGNPPASVQRSGSAT